MSYRTHWKFSVVRRHERRYIRRSARLAAAEVARRALAEELGEPGLVLDLLVEDGGADRICPRVLAESEGANVLVGTDGAAFGFDQDREQILERGAGRRLAALQAVGEVGVGAAGDVGEAANVAGQLAAQLVDARHQSLEVVAVLDAGVLDDLLEAFAI